MAMVFTYIATHPGPINTVVGTWTSDASGDAAGSCKAVSGRVIKVVTDPSATAAPTADYDVAITDQHSIDIFSGANDDLTDRHTSNTEEVYAWTEIGTNAAVRWPEVNGALTFTVSNAGDTKAGVIYLYWEAGSR